MRVGTDFMNDDIVVLYCKNDSRGVLDGHSAVYTQVCDKPQMERKVDIILFIRVKDRLTYPSDVDIVTKNLDISLIADDDPFRVFKYADSQITKDAFMSDKISVSKVFGMSDYVIKDDIESMAVPSWRIVAARSIGISRLGGLISVDNIDFRAGDASLPDSFKLYMQGGVFGVRVNRGISASQYLDILMGKKKVTTLYNLMSFERVGFPIDEEFARTILSYMRSLSNMPIILQLLSAIDISDKMEAHAFMMLTIRRLCKMYATGASRRKIYSEIIGNRALNCLLTALDISYTDGSLYSGIEISRTPGFTEMISKANNSKACHLIASESIDY